VNGIANPSGLRVGQSLKLPRGAFHGEVRKGEYRLNIFMGDGADRVMVASYPIGLGELNSTPTGTFMVRPRSKLIDPEWRNPRTGEFYAANDPKNPIGERWIGLKGIEPHNKGFEGYGIHGTVDLDSIGQQRSMGCVRMRPGDVEVVYELMTEPNSTVTIAP
jgi:lipoprotein-anchoring transpeptidase ErfK/SrfK